MMNLGAHLIKLRWAAGYTVARLSAQSHVDKTMIEMFEQGSLDVPVLDALALFQALDADLIGILNQGQPSAGTAVDEDLDELSTTKVQRDRVIWRRQQTSLRARQTTERTRFLVAEHKRLLKLANELILGSIHFQAQQAGGEIAEAQ
jgi:predicted transcriptional regulator